jgi:hypothetical protein
MDLHQLQLLVRQQQRTILKLQNQLNAVLSFIGTDEDDLLVDNEQCNSHSDQSLSHSSSAFHDKPAIDTDSSNASNALPSWSEVARRKRPINLTKFPAVGGSCHVYGPNNETEARNKPHCFRA